MYASLLERSPRPLRCSICHIAAGKTVASALLRRLAARPVGALLYVLRRFADHGQRLYSNFCGSALLKKMPIWYRRLLKCI